MELNYNIKLQQLSSEVLEANLKMPSETLSASVYKTEFGLTLKSNSENISNYFKETSQLIKNMKLDSNYILGYDEDPSWGYQERGSFEITRDYLDTFLSGPDRYNLEPVIEGKFVRNISDQDTVNLLSFKEGVFSLESLDKFEITYSDFKVNIQDPEEDSHYFLLVFKNNIKYERLSDTFNIPTNQFINLSNDFYQIIPSFKKSSYSLNSTPNLVSLRSTNPLDISSSFNVNYDNYTAKEFFLIPKFKIDISYSCNDYTPLNEVESFDPSNEFVILKLEEGDYKPIYHLSSKFPITADKTEYNLLLQSHEEFKKPYFVIAEKATITIKDPLRSTTLDSETIYNKDFESLKNTNTSVDGNVIPLTKIKI